MGEFQVERLPPVAHCAPLLFGSGADCRAPAQDDDQVLVRLTRTGPAQAGRETLRGDVGEEALARLFVDSHQPWRADHA